MLRTRLAIAVHIAAVVRDPDELTFAGDLHIEATTMLFSNTLTHDVIVAIAKPCVLENEIFSGTTCALIRKTNSSSQDS
jgi:hypothetical protein